MTEEPEQVPVKNAKNKGVYVKTSKRRKALTFKTKIFFKAISMGCGKRSKTAENVKGRSPRSDIERELRVKSELSQIGEILFFVRY